MLAGMGRSSSSVWGRYALVAACSGLAGCLLSAWQASSVPDPVLGPALEDRSAEWDRMHLRLDALQQQMEEVLAKHSSQSVAPVERIAVPEANPADERIEATLEHLERVAAALGSGAGNTTPLPQSPVNWSALNALHALEERDGKAANRSTMLLTPFQIAARFGFPCEAGAANGGNSDGTYWQYNRIGPDGKRTGHVLFCFRDGRVAFHEINLPVR